MREATGEARAEAATARGPHGGAASNLQGVGGGASSTLTYS